MLKRRKQKKTDYRQRLNLLRSGKPRIVIRKTSQAIKIQLIKYETKGDKTILEITSKHLEKYGWSGHSGNIPSSYLAGLLFGVKAKKICKEGVLDLGLQVSIKGNAIYSALKGIVDAGVDVPHGDVFPSDSRIRGEDIAKYANELKSNPAKYKKQFSDYIKRGMSPENIPQNFDEVKNKILSEFGIEIKDSEDEEEEWENVEGD